ncbi:DUF397 domain-containing protein [Streptomyces hygroscopicus subsp. hygroscopicus]|nr:DUF397 domain-containing protein [Streptomyces hygroscopicus]MBW8094038.1 DUF397 domain-containing protein [Streptomyces hygroscopicus subsp. hygroscopicus]
MAPVGDQPHGVLTGPGHAYRCRDECVEVAVNVPDAVAVRDSKNPDGPVLRFTPAAWADFRRALTSAPES